MKSSFLKLAVLLSLVTMPSHVLAEPKKELYIMGGGGEPEGSSTMFDSDLSSMAKFTQSSNWNTVISFNGGHEKTENIIKNKMDKARSLGTFTQENYDKIINEMISKLEKGELKENDQLMVEINTHGKKKSDSDITHVVASSGYHDRGKYFASPAKLSLDRLQKLIDLVEEKKVKLAIVDLSCYSGNTLNLKGKNTCLISATSADTYGYGAKEGIFNFSGPGNFAGTFHDQMKKGKNLETLFLEARAVGHNPDFPRISSETGKEVEKMLYDFTSPFLTYNKDPGKNEYYLDDKDKFEAQVCSLNNTYNNLEEIFSHYNSIAQISNKIYDQEFAAFKKAMTNYREAQLKYESVFRDRLELNEELGQLLKTHYQNEGQWTYYEPITYILIDETENIKRLEKVVSKKASSGFTEGNEKDLEKAINRKKVIDGVIGRLSPESRAKLERAQNLKSVEYDSFTLAARVSIESKKMYLNLYKKLMEKEKSNPCREFVL